jgi:hypothetical protein
VGDRICRRNKLYSYYRIQKENEERKYIEIINICIVKERNDYNNEKVIGFTLHGIRRM